MRGCTLCSVLLAHFASLGNIGSTYLSPLQIDSNVQAHTTRSKIMIIIKETKKERKGGNVILKKPGWVSQKDPSYINKRWLKQ